VGVCVRVRPHREGKGTTLSIGCVVGVSVSEGGGGDGDGGCIVKITEGELIGWRNERQ
jgi:hypothetical protein